ncbi:MAG: SpoIID/LytB domain-containing protein, partial [Oscillospiraceae bacterium]|nr:SpoIID/LytB domain-containing protein [Oscillospiraceae bacterium]
MKSRLAASFLAAAFSIALPLFNLPQEKALSPQGSLWYEPSEPEIRSDSELYITLLDGERTLTLSMEEYLYGAVAAEMPASFHIEALKAQAVALRTYALYKIEVSPSENHGEDLCSSSSCCAAWKPDEYLREKWGADYALYSRIIHSAVSSTDGEYLVFGGEPVLAVFHASSDGKTESSAAVWGK